MILYVCVEFFFSNICMFSSAATDQLNRKNIVFFLSILLTFRLESQLECILIGFNVWLENGLLIIISKRKKLPLLFFIQWKTHRICVVCRQENEWNVNDVNMGLNCPSFFWYAICTIFLHSLSSFHFFLNFQFWCCRCNSTDLIAHAVTMSGFILQIDSINLLE